MTNAVAPKDSDIRSALHAKHLRRVKACADTIVIDELGLAHARCRIDVAVINGHIHGYEIKSARDTLRRLESQIAVYRETLQKLTIVAAPNHIEQVLWRAPEWCGVIKVEPARGSTICFRVVRTARLNPDMNPVMMAHLLWRTETIDLLTGLGFAPKELRRPRVELYGLLCEALTPRQLTSAIRSFMAQRRAWRDHPLPA